MTIMKTMRHNFKYLKYFIWLLVAVFVVGFAFSFGSSKQSGNEPALVGGEPISERDFSKAVQQRSEALHDQYGAELPKGELRKARREILDQMIEESLAVQGALKLGMKVSDQELAQALQGVPDFRGKDGKFDPARYQQFLQMQAQQGTHPDTLIEGFRRRLLLSKARQAVEGQVQVQAAEVQAALEKASRKAKAKGALFLHKDLEAKLKLEEEEVRDYYSKNRRNWEKPERVKASHILVQPKQEDGAQGEAKAQEQAAALAKQAKAGADFAKLAREHSADKGSAERGGQLGSFARGEMVPEFEKAAFGMKPGQVSDPVKSQFGWHVIKVESREEGFKATWENSGKKAEEALRGERARDAARKAAAQLATRVAAGEDLGAVAKALGATLAERQGLTRSAKRVFDALGDAPGLAASILNLEVGGSTEALSFEKGSVVAKLEAAEAGSLPSGKELDQLKGEFLMRLRRERGEELWQQWVDSQKAKIKVTDRFEAYFGKED